MILKVNCDHGALKMGRVMKILEFHDPELN